MCDLLFWFFLCVCPRRANILSDKWRERTTVLLSPLITWYSKMRAYWYPDPNIAKTYHEAKAPEPLTCTTEMTSTFYVSSTSDNELVETYEGSGRVYAGDLGLMQYRVELHQD